MCHYSIEFVKAFENITDFRQAAEFLEFWTKVKRNKVSELTSDLPKLIEHSLTLRNDKEKADRIHQGSILIKHPGISSVDFSVWFCLTLLEAISQKPNLTLTLSRIVMSYIYLAMKENYA
jgi:hypothetical protein